MVRNFYPDLLAGSSHSADAAKLATRIFEFSEFLVKVAQVVDVGANFRIASLITTPATLFASCV